MLKTLQLVSVRWWNASAYYAISLAEAMNQAGYPAFAGGRIDSPPIRQAIRSRLPVFTGINLESMNPGQAWRNLREIRRFQKTEGIALVNAHRPEDHFFSVMAQKFSGSPRPIIRTVSDVRAPKDHPMNRWLHEKSTNFFIFSCQASLNRYQSIWPIFENKSAVIYSAIDTDHFRPPPKTNGLRRKLGIPAECLLVGVIARLSPVKDHETFLKAAARAAAQNPNLRFLISGEAVEISHQQLQDRVAQLGISSKTIILDRDDSVDIRDLIQMLDIGVVPSKGSEVICRVAVEYMAMGKPLVVTDINVLPEIVEDGRNGWVVASGDEQVMADRILQLAADRDMRLEMGRTARRIAEQKFSFPVLVDKTIAVYKMILEQSR